MNVRLRIALALLVALPGVVLAEGFSAFGPRSMGMAGAFSSVAHDPSAMYWNPSLLILRGETWNLSWFQGETRTEKADFIEDLRAAIALNPFRADRESLADLPDYLESLAGYKMGVGSGDHLAFAFHHKRAGFMIVEREDRQAALDIDLENVLLIDHALTPITNNQSKLLLSALRRTEFITSYSSYSQGLGLLVGVNLKFIQAKSYLNEVGLWDLEPTVSTRQLLNSTTDGAAESDSAFSWDVALSAVVGSGNLALTGKDITGYELKRKDRDEFKIKPAYRLGYSTQIAANFLLAVDYDLTSNRDPYSDESNRSLAWGMEKWFGSEKGLGIRAGFSKRLGEESYPNYIFSAGLGFRLKWLNADVGGMMDSERNIQGISFQVLLSFDSAS